MRNDVAAGADDEERGQVVSDEQNVAGEEDDVVNEIHYEVGDAIIENQLLKRGVEASEAAIRVGEDGGGS